MHDVMSTINVIEEVVRGREERVSRSGLYYRVEDCVVGASFDFLGVSAVFLAALGQTPIEKLYEENLSPLPLTLGAMLVYRAVQRAQDGLSGGDCSWGSAFEKAVGAAGRLFDLVPDSVISTARKALVA